MRASDKNLTVFSDAEREALYSLPDFDDFQRTEYFSLTDEERDLAQKRSGISEQILCMLQIGYFKAKQTFFNLSFSDVPKEDIDFLLRCYFPGALFFPRPVRLAEYYAQRKKIVRLSEYRLWSKEFTSLVTEKAAELTLRDVTPTFILTELVSFLNQQKIVRPGYTTLQGIIIDVLSAERKRLGGLIEECLDEAGKSALKKLLVREDTLSELAAIKQDAKHFSYQMMVLERQKRATLEPLYQIAKVLLPKLEISQQNKNYYASLANFYSIYDLRRLKSGQTYLYLLCYVWQRYQQLSDNLVSSFCYQLKKLEEETKTISEQKFTQSQASKQQEAPQVGRLILLYVDEEIADATLFGTVRDRAFNIMPKDSLISAGQRLCEKSPTQMALRWEAVDKITSRCKKNLRPLAMATHFSSSDVQNPWLIVLNWMKTIFSRQQTLAQRPVTEIPSDTIPKRLRPHLLVLDEDGKETSIRGDRYEFWIYRQIRKRFDINELYLNDSVVNRRFSDDLVSMEQKADILKKLDIPWLRQPLNESIDTLYAELGQQWKLFNCELQHGKLKHLEYDSVREHLTWRKTKANKDDALQSGFYAKLKSHDIADIFRFVNRAYARKFLDKN